MTLPQKPKTLEEAWQIIVMLVEQNNKLEARVKELEGRLQKNSRNSSKPPSSDGYSRSPHPQSLRESSSRNPGGQNGHSGTTLPMVKKPDQVERHPVLKCQKCCRSLKHVKATTVERRQIYDLPPIKFSVTEHQGEVKCCPWCGAENRAQFPKGVNGVTGYGSRFQAMALYFMNQQLIPYERCTEIFRDIFSLAVSGGTLFEINRRGAENLEAVSAQIQQGIVQSSVAHFDESGVNVAGKLNWLHVASTTRLTHYDVHPKRGQAAMNEMGILPEFNGRAVHDHLASYFDYDNCDHALCNAHHLRELIFITEQEKEPWAKEMKSLLLEINQTVEEKKNAGKQRLSSLMMSEYERQYRLILQRGFRYHQRLPGLLQEGTRGRNKQRSGKNLLDRLQKRRKEALVFMRDFSVPFTNNLGERDIRMSKVKQKISGCFRSMNGAKIFCRIRGYISTAKKQGWNILKTLELLARGLPRIPALT